MGQETGHQAVFRLPEELVVSLPGDAVLPSELFATDPSRDPEVAPHRCVRERFPLVRGELSEEAADRNQGLFFEVERRHGAGADSLHFYSAGKADRPAPSRPAFYDEEVEQLAIGRVTGRRQVLMAGPLDGPDDAARTAASACMETYEGRVPSGIAAQDLTARTPVARKDRGEV